MNVWNVAIRHSESALKFRLGVKDAGHSPVQGGGILIQVPVAEPFLKPLENLGLSGPLDIGFHVSSDWLRIPLLTPGPRPYRVVTKATPHPGDRVLIAESMHVVDSLPGPGDLRRKGIDLTQSDTFDLMERLEELDETNRKESPSHQAFGFAQPLQNDIWRLLDSDLTRIGDIEALSRLRDMEHRLLLQIDSDADADLEIGDIGRLYVIAPSEDIQKGIFDRALACVEMS